MQRYLWRSGLALSIGIIVLVGAASAYLLALPGVGDAEARTHEVLDAHHGTFLALPPTQKLAFAVVAVEDRHFYSNIFVDMADGAARAGLALSSSADPGGITITQQLAKQLYPRGAGISGTLAEIGLAVKISLTYARAQVLNMWLNSVYYGNGYWGAQTAAEGYFGVPAGSLDWAEAWRARAPTGVTRRGAYAWPSARSSMSTPYPDAGQEQAEVGRLRQDDGPTTDADSDSDSDSVPFTVHSSSMTDRNAIGRSTRFAPTICPS